MIRLASIVALVTFWLAAIGWTVVAVAAPANAQTGAISSSSADSSLVQATATT